VIRHNHLCFLLYFIIDDFQNTLKSSKSHVTTEANSLANVSDPASGGSSQATADRTGSVNKQLTRSTACRSISPPHHNYSNIQHPISRAVSNQGGSLTSSRTQSSNASPAMAASPVSANGPPNIPPPPIPSMYLLGTPAFQVPRHFAHLACCCDLCGLKNHNFSP
jgi:hypothetical protein